MLDAVLEWAVVVLPFLLAVGIEVIGERARRTPAWKAGVIAFGIVLSSLAFWQERRSAENSRSAVTQTAERVATETSSRVTDSLNKQYGPVISGLYKEISDLQSKVETQSNLRRQELSLNYAPSVDLIYAGDQLQIWNRGKTNLKLWGDRYNGGAISMSDTPYVISPTTYRYLLTDTLKANILGTIGQNGEARVPLEIYITTADGQRYIVRGELWEIVKDGQITIHTQNHGFDKVDWFKHP
ncbi:MAG: hypothetical protein WAM39_23800 [Bryobacteraceae bacterium]